MNVYRGETTLDLGGTPVVLRPEFTALAEVEGKLGVGLIDLVQAAMSGRLRLTQILIVIQLTMAKPEPGEKVMPPSVLMEAIMVAGPTIVASSLGEFLVKAMAGGVEGNGKAPVVGSD